MNYTIFYYKSIFLFTQNLYTLVNIPIMLKRTIIYKGMCNFNNFITKTSYHYKNITLAYYKRRKNNFSVILKQ